MTVTDQIHAKFAVQNHLVIRASAGTGKTFQLSNRFLQLVLAGRPADQILATTFTRKAAGEILQRVMVRLALAADHQDACDQLAEEIEWVGLSQRECRRVLRDFTRNLHRLRIATLDAFFLQATQSLSLELGLPPSWQIVSEHEEQLIQDEAIAEFVESENRDAVLQLMHWLSKGEARRGIHQLVRETISESYAVFQESESTAWHGLDRQKPLSHAELRETLDQLGDVQLPAKMRSAWEQDLCQAEQSDWERLIQNGIAGKVAQGQTKYNRTEIPEHVLPLYRRLVSHAVAELRNRVVMQTESTYQLLSRFHQHFENAKLRQRVLLFSDLGKNLASLPDVAQLRHLAFRLDASIDSLLLDEFQDTSLHQWQVMRPFAKHATDEQQGGSFLCVGDQKQAIYGWRGGDADLLDAVGNELDNTLEVSLDKSYRSSRPVIETVNQINRLLTAHPNLGHARAAAEQWVERFPTHETARFDLDGCVSVCTARLAAETKDQRNVTLQGAVERVGQIVKQAPGLSVAVLVRTNEVVGKLIFELHRKGISASEEGGNPLIDSAAVQLILSLVTLADHPGDTVARFHLCRSPWGPLLGLQDHTSDDQADAVARRVRESIADQGFGPAILGFARQIRPSCNKREWRRLLQLVELAYVYQGNIEKPRTIGHQLQSRLSTRCDAFVQFVRNQRVADPSVDAVRVMTIHQAKGLQFDLVVLPDLDRKLTGQTPLCVASRPEATEPVNIVCRYASEQLRAFLPRHYQKAFESHQTAKVREELCVLYVALTRAKHGMEVVISPSAPTEKRLPLSAAGLIRAALTGGEPLGEDQLVYECGTPNWFRRTGPAAEPSSFPRLIPAIRLAPRRMDSTRSHRVARPSQLEGDGGVRIRDRLTMPHASSMQFGSLIHAFFEQIAWIEDGTPSVDSLVSVARRLDADDQHIEKAIHRFQQMIARPEIVSVLSRRYYSDRLSSNGNFCLDVRREQPLMATCEDRVVSGCIDRLVVVKNGQIPRGADIVDFKTDSVTGRADLQAKVAHYQPQLEAYASGVTRMLRINPRDVTARLVFLGSGDVISV